MLFIVFKLIIFDRFMYWFVLILLVFRYYFYLIRFFMFKEYYNCYGGKLEKDL